MDAQYVIWQAMQLGITLRSEDGNIHFRPQSAATDSFIALLKREKAKVIELLTDIKSRESRCHNNLTPHATHDNPMMCREDSCGCYREYGKPYLCSGAPCRWTFPDYHRAREP